MEKKSEIPRHVSPQTYDAPAASGPSPQTFHVQPSGLRSAAIPAAGAPAGKRRPAPLSYEEVAQAAQAIDAAGEKVTIARIRQQVGGAAETVTAFLGRWRQTRRDARLHGGGSDGLPEALRAALFGAFADQREAAQVEMQERLQEQNEAASELDAELRRARATIEEHESAMASLREQLQQAQQALLQREQDAVRGSEKVAGQTQTLIQQVEDLRREHIETREQLVQARCQAEAESGRAQMLAGENERLLAELAQANGRADDAREKAAASEQKAAVAHARLEGQTELLAIAKAQAQQADMRAAEHLERARGAESLEDRLRHKLDVAHHAHDASQAPAGASAKTSPPSSPAGSHQQTSSSKPKDAKP